MARKAKNETDFWQTLEQAEADNDLEAVDGLIEGFVESNHSTRPFSASIDLDKKFRQKYFAHSDYGVEAGFGGNLAIHAANALARTRRRIAYRLKTAHNFNGLKLVEEGDSWTQYPIFLKDIVDQLAENDDIAIYSVGAAGDLISNMAVQKEYMTALRTTGAEGLIISGAGNDIFDDFGRLLNPYATNLPAEKLINEIAWNKVFAEVIASYDAIITDVAAEFPSTIIFGHGYDLPYPIEDGGWIGPPLLEKGIPLDKGREVLKVIMDRFNNALSNFSSSYPNFIFNDLRGVVDRGHASWEDELHPKNSGYERAADVFETSIRRHLAERAANFEHSTVISTKVSNVEHHTSLGSKTIVLDPGHGGPSSPPTVGGSSWNNAVGPKGTLEKNLTLDVAKRTRDILTDRGFSAKLTREADVNLGLSKRANVAKELQSAVFVSIHFNASTHHNAQGTETFVHSRHENYPTGENSKQLCLTVQAEMVNALGLKDRNSYHPGGIKYGKFGVLNPNSHASGTASILHEVSFLDREKEEENLQKVSYRRKISIALADGIEAYLTAQSQVPENLVSDIQFEDGIEFAAFQDSDEAKQNFNASSWSNGNSHSNGHMIAESNSGADDFIQQLARYEALRAKTGHMDHDFEPEANEPSEFDPLVERTFSQLGANVESNITLLDDLFGNYLTAPGTHNDGFDLSEFQEFIDSLNLEFFSASEFLVKGASNRPGGSGAGLNTNPPRELWANLGNTAKMLDEIRRRLGSPIYLLSVYRSPAYNEAIGGATRSRHMKFDAIDWYSTRGTVHEWHSIARKVRDDNPSAYSGWMKAYTGSNFVHIDTRNRTTMLSS